MLALDLLKLVNNLKKSNMFDVSHDCQRLKINKLIFLKNRQKSNGCTVVPYCDICLKFKIFFLHLRFLPEESSRDL